MEIIDMITGQNPNQGQIDQSNNAANQATGAENQLIQSQLVPIFNQLVQNYQKNYNPAATGLGQMASGLTNIGGVHSIQDLLNYTTQPGQTNLAQVTPQAMAQFLAEAKNGLSPQTIGAALNTDKAATQSQIASLRNNIGAGVPNAAGLASDLNLQGLQGLTGTESQLAGMNQEFQNQGMLQALQSATGLDAQKLQMLMTGSQTGQNIFDILGNYNQQGLGSLEAGASGFNNLAGLYGSAAGNAANNATNAANAGNQMIGNMFSGLTGLAGAAMGAGIFPSFSGGGGGINMPTSNVQPGWGGVAGAWAG